MCAAPRNERTQRNHSWQSIYQLLSKRLLLTDKSEDSRHLYSNRNLVGMLAAAVSIVTLTIVGISTIRNNPEISTLTNTQSVRTDQTQPSVADSTRRDLTGRGKSGKTVLPPIIGDFGFELGPAERSSPAQPITLSKKVVSIPTPEATPEATRSRDLPAVAELPQQPVQPSSKQKEFQEIGVEVRIEDGRVIEAHVKNRQPGAEPFEATAIHIARQRRYAPGTSSTETVMVRVANQLGRNAQ
jgi:hypothetical protein